MSGFVPAFQFGGLSFGDLVSDIPRDAGAVLVFLVLGALIFLVWYGSRADVIERYSASRWSDPDGPKRDKTGSS